MQDNDATNMERPMNLMELDTPCLVLHRPALLRNAERMLERARHLGVALRPHLKTAKSVEVARVATGANTAPIAVSTLREAEYFAKHGYNDMLYAVCITPDKLDRVASLNRNGVRCAVITDSVAVAKAIARHEGLHTALIEVDCGEHRTGVAPDSPDLMSIARILDAGPRTFFGGVITHGGHSYACRDPQAIRGVAEQERLGVLRARDRLATLGLACAQISVGSTPTACFAEGLDGVTEMRPGVYLFGDLFQAGMGVCEHADIACSVLATVISHRAGDNAFVIDAGGLALSKDTSTAGTSFDAQYGWVVAPEPTAQVGDLRVASVHQEHGEVTGTSEVSLDAFPVGARVRVLPNHICMTAAMYDRYYVVDDSTEVVDVWHRTNGWARL